MHLVLSANYGCLRYLSGSEQSFPALKLVLNWYVVLTGQSRTPFGGRFSHGDETQLVRMAKGERCIVIRTTLSSAN